MSLWSQLILSLWLLASGHDGRKGSTGLHGALHPEVIMSLSAKGDIEEEARKRVMRKDFGSSAEEQAEGRRQKKKRRQKKQEDAAEETEDTKDSSETVTEAPSDEEMVTEAPSDEELVTEAPSGENEALGPELEADANSKVADAAASTSVAPDADTDVAASTETPEVSTDAKGSSTEAPEVSSDAASASTEVPTEQVSTDDATGEAESPSEETQDPAADTMEVEAKEPEDASGGSLKKVATEDEEEEAGESMGLDDDEQQEQIPSPDACDSGGSSEPKRPLTFNVYAPAQAPFTLSFRTKWTGVDPPNMEPNPVCIFCWTINPDTAPSSNKAQFFRGVDGQPPRIALMRMGNVIAYEELSADGKEGLSNSITSDTKLNDGSEHEVVLVRGTNRITLWIDGKPDCFVSSESKAFQSAQLPAGRPQKVSGRAATANQYLKKQVRKTATYNKMDPYQGKWALDGSVTNVRLDAKELSANQFPSSKQSCEETTTTAPFICHSTCGRCNGETAEDCLSCNGARFLHSKECVEECPEGFYGNKVKNRCYPCHESCATCDSKKETGCQSCASEQVLYKGRCLSGCPRNHFADLNAQCQSLAGSVVALKTSGLGSTYLLMSNSTECVELVPMESEEFSNPRVNIKDEAKMWMVSDSGDQKAVLRNVQTGMALRLKTSDGEENPGCSSSVSSCAVARPPKPVYGELEIWNDTQWQIHQCEKNAFSIMSLGNGKIALQLAGRSLQFAKDVLSFSADSESDSEEESIAGSLETAENQRFEPLIVLPAVKVVRKTKGRCSHLITEPLSCSAAVGGLGIDDFADFTQQGANPKHPPGCFYYTEEFSAPFTEEKPVKVVRVVLNVGEKADYLRYADCSVKTPCVCAVLE